MNKRILKLALPNIISNLTVPLVGIVDVALMGHLSNSAYLGAIALGASLFTFIYAGLGFIRMGTSGFTAQSFGEKNIEKSFLILARAFAVALSAGIVLILAQKGISYLAFYFIDSSPEVQNFAMQYFEIRIWAAPAGLSLFALTGWYIGMQDSKTPMFIAILVHTSNIVLSAFFVLKGGMTVNGVAFGTLISQYVGLIVGFLLLSKHRKRIKKYWQKKLIFVWAEIAQFMNVNKDILIRSLLLTGSFYFFNAASADLGDDILAVNSVLLQFLWTFSYFIDGFAYAAEALIGKYIGAGAIKNIKKLVKLLFVWGFGLSLLISLIYYLFNDEIIGLLTDKQKIIALAAKYRLWVVVLPLAGFSAFVWDGIYVGATKGKAMRNAMIISALCVFLPSVFIFENLLGNHGMWLALFLFMLARGLSLHLLFSKTILSPLR